MVDENVLLKPVKNDTKLKNNNMVLGEKGRMLKGKIIIKYKLQKGALKRKMEKGSTSQGSPGGKGIRKVSIYLNGHYKNHVVLQFLR